MTRDGACPYAGKERDEEIRNGPRRVGDRPVRNCTLTGRPVVSAECHSCEIGRKEKERRRCPRG